MPTASGVGRVVDATVGSDVVRTCCVAVGDIVVGSTEAATLVPPIVNVEATVEVASTIGTGGTALVASGIVLVVRTPLVIWTVTIGVDTVDSMDLLDSIADDLVGAIAGACNDLLGSGSGACVVATTDGVGSILNSGSAVTSACFVVTSGSATVVDSSKAFGVTTTGKTPRNPSSSATTDGFATTSSVVDSLILRVTAGLGGNIDFAWRMVPLADDGDGSGCSVVGTTTDDDRLSTASLVAAASLMSGGGASASAVVLLDAASTERAVLVDFAVLDVGGGDFGVVVVGAVVVGGGGGAAVEIVVIAGIVVVLEGNGGAMVVALAIVVDAVYLLVAACVASERMDCGVVVLVDTTGGTVAGSTALAKSDRSTGSLGRSTDRSTSGLSAFPVLC